MEITLVFVIMNMNASERNNGRAPTHHTWHGQADGAEIFFKQNVIHRRWLSGQCSVVMYSCVSARLNLSVCFR